MILITYGRHIHDPAIFVLGNALKTLGNDDFEFIRLKSRAYNKNLKSDKESFKEIKQKCKEIEKSGKTIDLIVDLHTGFAIETQPSFDIHYYWENRRIAGLLSSIKKQRKQFKYISELPGDQFNQHPSSVDQLAYEVLGKYGNRFVLFEFYYAVNKVDLKEMWPQFLSPRREKRSIELTTKKQRLQIEKLLKTKEQREQVSEALDEMKVILLIFKEHLKIA